MASGLSPRLHLPYPLETDVPDVAADVQSLTTALDHTAITSQDTLANRPAAAASGKQHMVQGAGTSANNGILWWDTGSAWIAVNPNVSKAGTRATRPAANVFAVGGLYYATDTGITYQSDGVSTWTAVAWDPIFATTIPTSPAPEDGQLIEFLADGTNGVIWQFRYRAASASTYKWEFVGGAALFSTVANAETTASTTYADLTTVGPAVTLPTLPNGGDFDVTFGGRLSIGTGSAVNTGFMTVATPTLPADSDSVQVSTTNDTVVESVDRTLRKTSLASAIAITAKYKAFGTSASLTAQQRYLSVVPVRVG